MLLFILDSKISYNKKIILIEIQEFIIVIFLFKINS